MVEMQDGSGGRERERGGEESEQGEYCFGFVQPPLSKEALTDIKLKKKKREKNQPLTTTTTTTKH